MAPLVSCVCPTKNRYLYIEGMIQCFLSQTYPHKELIIVDNGIDGTARLIPNDPSIFYHYVAEPKTTGEMRNLCAERANGEIICHFDSDDWSAPERVTDQVTRLGNGVLTGYHMLLFFDERDGIAYKYKARARPIGLGTSMCYTKAWWEHLKFRAIPVGEDSRFWMDTQNQVKEKVSYADAKLLMVARVHHNQTSIKRLRSSHYHMLPAHSLPATFHALQHHH